MLCMYPQDFVNKLQPNIVSTPQWGEVEGLMRDYGRTMWIDLKAHEESKTQNQDFRKRWQWSEVICGSDLSDFLNRFTVTYLFLKIWFMYFEPYSENGVLSSHFYFNRFPGTTRII